MSFLTLYNSAGENYYDSQHPLIQFLSISFPHGPKSQKTGGETYLRVPSILPRSQFDNRVKSGSRILLPLLLLQNTPQSLRRKPDLEASIVSFKGFILVMKTLGQSSEDLPFRGVLFVGKGLLLMLREFGAPDCVDTKILRVVSYITS
jgi:hypothetical protein